MIAPTERFETLIWLTFCEVLFMMPMVPTVVRTSLPVSVFIETLVHDTLIVCTAFALTWMLCMLVLLICENVPVVAETETADKLVPMDKFATEMLLAFTCVAVMESTDMFNAEELMKNPFVEFTVWAVMVWDVKLEMFPCDALHVVVETLSANKFVV